MAVRTYVVQADCTVRGEPVRKGSLVALDLGDSELAGQYGPGNLQPLPSDQSGDDAGHSALEN
jgi:hypothetical protein